MTDRELRLRARIDQLLDERERLRTRVDRLSLDVRNERRKIVRREGLAAELKEARDELRKTRGRLSAAERNCETLQARLTGTEIDLQTRLTVAEIELKRLHRRRMKRVRAAKAARVAA